MPLPDYKWNALPKNDSGNFAIIGRVVVSREQLDALYDAGELGIAFDVEAPKPSFKLVDWRDGSFSILDGETEKVVSYFSTRHPDAEAAAKAEFERLTRKAADHARDN